MNVYFSILSVDSRCTRCLSEILNLTPKGDHLGVAQAFCDPLKETNLGVA